MEKINKSYMIYFVVLVTLGFGLFSYILKLGVIATIIGYGLIALVFLSIRYPVIGRIINSGLAGYLKFAVGLFIATGSAVLFRGLNAISVGLSPWLLIVLLMVWGALLTLAILYLIIEKNRIQLFGLLRSQIGWGAPFAYSYALMWSGIFFFSSLTYALVEGGILLWINPGGKVVTQSAITDYYLWHFLNAVPGFKITETLLWEAPLKYDNGWVGFLLLLFKILVISPIIGAFIWYWRDFGKEIKDEESKGKVEEKKKDSPKHRVKKT